jgi:hypothetical protein
LLLISAQVTFIREARPLFHKYNFVYVFRQVLSLFGPDNAFLALNIRSALLNLEDGKETK